jgi:uncharacterized membrane protein
MYQWIVWVHILAAIIWIGGMFFLPLVLVPVLRRQEPKLRAVLLDAVGRRFRTVGWIAIGLLLVTCVGPHPGLEARPCMRRPYDQPCP